MEDLPMPQAPETPIEIGRPFAWTMISATVSATPEKFRKSRSVSLSGHIVGLTCYATVAVGRAVPDAKKLAHRPHVVARKNLYRTSCAARTQPYVERFDSA